MNFLSGLGYVLDQIRADAVGLVRHDSEVEGDILIAI